MSEQEIINAQAYLENVATLGGDWLAEKGWAINVETGVPLGYDVKCHVGLPRRRSKKTQAIILPARDSDANLTEVFIAANISDSREVIGLIIRCLVQIATGALNKPNRQFVAAALKLGFGGPNDMMAPIEGTELSNTIDGIIAQIGDYPHAATGAEYKPQETTLFKLACENEKCKAKKGSRKPTIRVSAAWATSGWTCFSCHTKLTVYSNPPKD